MNGSMPLTMHQSAPPCTIAPSARASAGGLKRPPATPLADGGPRERHGSRIIERGRAVAGSRPHHATRDPMRAKTPPHARRLTTTTRLRARGLQGGPQPPLRSRPRTKGIRIQGHPRSIRDLGRHRASEHASARAPTQESTPLMMHQGMAPCAPAHPDPALLSVHATWRRRRWRSRPAITMMAKPSGPGTTRTRRSWPQA